jgi:YidC/Oxa1 family membrane protein insertase
MDIYAFGPVAGILSGAYSLVTLIATVLAPTLGSASAGAAVVALTILVRVILIPVGVSQVRAEYTRRRLAPKLAELQQKYSDDRVVLQAKVSELYAAEKASPFAGCLPLLLQAPVVSLIYALFLHQQIAGHGNGLLAHSLGGVPLGTSFIHLMGTAAGAWPGITVFLVVLTLIAGVAAASRRLLAVPAVPGTPVAPAVSASPSVSRLAVVMSFAPFITVVIAAFVPLAAALYLATTTAWTLAERVTLRRLLDPNRAGRQSPPGRSRAATN